MPPKWNEFIQGSFYGIYLNFTTTAPELKKKGEKY
tara:strand:+ start:1406 stop:1510 length:105 start_codon:yes stop_codon:yes gene_type:complete